MSIYLKFIISVFITGLFGAILWFIVPIYVEPPVFIPGFAPGPDVWPTAIATAGLVAGCLSIAFAWFSIWKNKSCDLILTKIIEWASKNSIYVMRAVSSIIILFAYLYCLPIIGIVLASMVLLVTLFLFIGIKQNVKWMISLSIIFPIAIYFVFSQVTNTMFPNGWIWDLIPIVQDFIG